MTTIIRITDDTTVGQIDAELARLHRGTDDTAIDSLLAARHEKTDGRD